MATTNITNTRETEFTGTSEAVGQRARSLCTGLLQLTESASNGTFQVEKYLGELAVKLGGTYTPAP